MAFWIALGVCIAISLVIPLLVAAERGQWRGSYIYGNAWHSAWWGVGVFAFFMFVAGMVATVGYTDPRHYTATATEDLQALKTSDRIEGHFFLASGTVDEETVYRWLSKAEDGIITQHEIPARRAYIVENDNPRLEYRWQCNTWVFPWGACQRPAHVFYVPPGSVLNEYEVTP